MHLHSLTFDAADPPALAHFWAAVTGYEVVQTNPYFAEVTADGRVGPRFMFIKVPEPKTAKNRVHLDLAVSGGRGTPPEEARARVATAVDRAVAAGATRLKEYDERGEHWVVLQDPEGNEFCFH